MKLWNKYRIRIVTQIAVAIAAAWSPSILRADGPTDRPTIRGDVQVIDGVTILRVYGDPHDRGFAHGYLMADEIIALLDGYLAAEDVSGGPARFDALARRMRGLMKLPPADLEELRGMLAGIERRLDGKTTVPRLGRALTLDDLIAVNCIPDAAGLGCSSFAAWGQCTLYGETIAGRNLDWFSMPAMRNSQIVLAVIPAKDEKAAAWLTVTWPGLVGCLTGMNEHGVTVSMHDADTGPLPSDMKPTPRALILREAIQAAHEISVQKDIISVLSRHRTLVANIIPVAAPMPIQRESFLNKDGEVFIVKPAELFYEPPSWVFEYNGHLKKSPGECVRSPATTMVAGWVSPAEFFQIATNHFRLCDSPARCDRYESLEKGLSEFSADGRRLKVDDAWNLLAGVSVKGRLTTYHSVVCEPNRLKLHVSFCTAAESAPTAKRVDLDVAALLERPRGEIAATP